MRVVRALLATEIHLGVAASRWWLGGWRTVMLIRGFAARGHRLTGRSTIVLTRACVAAGGRFVAVRRLLGLKTLHRGPGLDQCPVHGEMLVRKQRRHRLVRQDRRQELAGDVGGEQAVAIFAKHRRHPHRIVDTKPHKPAE
jgi:hypothetical protein